MSPAAVVTFTRSTYEIRYIRQRSIKTIAEASGRLSRIDFLRLGLGWLCWEREIVTGAAVSSDDRPTRHIDRRPARLSVPMPPGARLGRQERAHARDRPDLSPIGPKPRARASGRGVPE